MNANSKETNANNTEVTENEQKIENEDEVASGLNKAQSIIAEKFKEEIEGLKESYKEQLLRAMAETENVRNRMQRQIEDASKYAVSSFAKDLINVAENLSRAMSSVKIEEVEDKLLKALYEGVSMTAKELANVFTKHNIVTISPAPGDNFDHNLHQAVAQVENNEFPSGTIATCMQNGYIINDRLLRPAIVTVVKAS